MGNSYSKPIIGIVGGICSGKSTVSSELTKHGCKVIDADKIAHEVLKNQAIIRKVTEIFSSAVLDSKGEIDRKKLAKIVFRDSYKLTKLNQLIHPPVLAQIEELIIQYEKDKIVKAIVLDIPLLIEVGWANRCDSIIFVECSEKNRAQRAKKTGIYDQEEIKNREKNQISLDNKVKLADNVIDNNSGLPALIRQVTEVFNTIIKDK